jgi:Tol biopolymer transport system component
LNADGTETRVTAAGVGEPGPITGGSFTPDGSQVVYAEERYLDGVEHSRIYIVSAQGGRPTVLAHRRWSQAVERAGHPHSHVYSPALSPDGSQIAYVEGEFDHSHALWVMNADGSEPRLLLDSHVIESANWIFHLAWSPDGTRIAVEVTTFRGGNMVFDIHVVEADGSNSTLAISDGVNPYWSPDGARIAYGRGRHFPYYAPLVIAASDGTIVEELAQGSSGPWNPAP